MPTLPPVPHGDRSLWLGYAGLCLLCWLLYAMAGAEWLRGGWRAWQAAWEATWHALDYGMAWALFGLEHADATLAQQALWRSAWAVFIYTALVLGFGGTLHARRAHAAALGIAQAEAARTRAELSAITGSLNPHFLFNTLNTLILLTRRDPAAAERGLLGFSRLLRQLLDTQRDASDRVTLRDEVDFVRDYLAIEALRLGERLRVDWRVEPDALDALLPPLTLQPLVENAVLHGIAPRIDGGTVTIEAARSAAGGLALRWPTGCARCPR
ncbi:histidine kinase [Piscinibacter sakaiensis]|uniref:sensor histidine kinase n=1 Tax=Piscinibacter sakaiensis TaxID=1547922 RepID=UPI00372829B4